MDNKFKKCTDEHFQAAVRRYRENNCDITACKFIYRQYLVSERFEKAREMKEWIDYLEGRSPHKASPSPNAIFYTKGALAAIMVLTGAFLCYHKIEWGASIKEERDAIAKKCLKLERENELLNQDNVNLVSENANLEWKLEKANKRKASGESFLNHLYNKLANNL